MRYQDENIWLTQKMMAALYDVDVRTINYHIKKIFDDAELSQGATIRNFRIVQTEGSRQVKRELEHYNLQMIIAVGFKVNNERAVRFRRFVKEQTHEPFSMHKCCELVGLLSSQFLDFFDGKGCLCLLLKKNIIQFKTMVLKNCEGANN
jgi:hypothetical protein